VTSLNRVFLKALANVELATVGRMSQLTKLSPKRCASVSSRLYASGRISRTKPITSSYYLYYMTQEQKTDYYRRENSDVSTTFAWQSQELMKSKLKYLRRLQEQPLNSSNLILQQIINDYVSALS